ncbi:MAG: hypothetical protein ABJC13_05220 [Acidobacteriota bacterium]
MSSGPPTKNPTKKKSKKEKLASIAEWDAIIGRYPPGNRASLVQQVVLMLASNAFIVYQLVTHRMQPLHLVLLVAIEAVLLSVVAFVQSRTVPPEAQTLSGQTARQRVGALAFGLFWLAMVYSLVFAGFLRAEGALWGLVRQPLETIRQGGLLWPLTITLIAAFRDSIQDASYFRDHRGKFLSTPGLNAVARWLTLFLGGIPFLIPLAAVGWVISKIIERLNRRMMKGTVPTDVRWALLVIPLLFLGMFSVMGSLISAGLSGWAICYCAAKFVSELLILCMPVIATKAKAEETAAL